VRTTVPDRAAAPAPDRVERAFAPAQIGGPDRLWLADISYVATAEGWPYLAVVLDGFSRRVVGWAMADHLRTELVAAALAMAVRARRPAPGLIHHSDSENRVADAPRWPWLSRPGPARMPAPGCSCAA
jgi:transposase InsO family protein